MRNKFSNLSDYEINKRVAEYQDFSNHFGSIFDEVYPKPSDCNEVVYLIANGLGNMGRFNPCEWFNDGMPIIVDNRISLVYMVGAWEAHALTEFGDEAHNTVNKNPLRAAMETFLMMKEEE